MSGWKSMQRPIRPASLTPLSNVGAEIVQHGRLARRPASATSKPLLRDVVERLPPAVQHALLPPSTMPEVSRRAIDTTEAVAFLRAQLLRQTEELAQLLGCSFPEWTALYGVPDAAAGPAFEDAAAAGR